MAISEYTKKGWFWENLLIEIPPPLFICNFQDNPFNQTQIDDIPGGSIFLDLNTYGVPETPDAIVSLAENQENYINIENVEYVITGWKEGKYNVYIAYYNHLGSVGPLIKATNASESGEDNFLFIDKTYLDQFGSGISVVPITGFIKPFDSNLNYLFTDKAIGVHIYVERFESIDGEPIPNIDKTIFPILDLNFSKGWKKIGDSVGYEQNDYAPFIEMDTLLETSPAIMQFGTSTYYNNPLLSFKSYHGFESFSVDIYRWKTAEVHNFRSWLGNVARLQRRIDSETNEPIETWGNILTAHPDRLLKSGHRNYDEYDESSFIDVVNEDGDEIIAIISFADLLYQFKRNSIYVLRTDGDKQGLVDTISMGVSHKSCITKTPHGICFANKRGVFIYTTKGISNLTEENIEFSSFYYESLNDYFDFDALIPALSYDPKSNQLIYFLQCQDGSLFQDLNFQEIAENLGQSADFNDDGIVNITDYILMLNQLVANNGIQLLYDFNVGSWVKFGSESSFTNPRGQKSNTVLMNENLIFFDNTNGLLYKWNDESYSNNFFKIQTPFIDFEYPTVEKKISEITISWKGTASQDPSIRIYCNINGGEDNIDLELADSSTAGEILGSGQSVLKNTTDTSANVSKFKLPTAYKDVYNISVILLSSYGNVDVNFEILDINISYQYKGIK
tara:strand:- start:1355 stop:3382 length:2028 start_codon:yes stop_codon:yes gene_type:complete